MAMNGSDAIPESNENFSVFAFHMKIILVLAGSKRKGQAATKTPARKASTNAHWAASHAAIDRRADGALMSSSDRC